MKLASLAFLFGLTSSVVYANDPILTEKLVVCHDTKTVFETLTSKKYNEVPIWAGADGVQRYVITVNKETKNWTIIQFNHEIACVIGNGEKSTMLFSRSNT